MSIVLGAIDYEHLYFNYSSNISICYGKNKEGRYMIFDSVLQLLPLYFYI